MADASIDAAAVDSPQSAAGDAPAAAPPVVVSLEILSLTKDAQNMNGMRDSNYEKYRRFCARKLVRLRNGLGMKVSKGKSKALKRYPLAEDVKDSRALQLLLFDAERAWAYAMELKAGIAGEPRKRHHMIARLRKATKHVDRLAVLAKAVMCDARTELEISAYVTWMHGVLAFEQQRWQEALDKFATARTVYERMAQVGNPAQRALCHARVEEIEPTLRFCAYNLEAGSGSALPTDLAQLVKLRSQMSAAGLTSLADKFEELMLSATPASAEGGPQSIRLGAREITLQNAKVRQLLQQAHQMHEAVMAAQDKRERTGMFDRLLMLLSDAARAALDDIKLNEEAQAKAKSEKGKDTTLELRAVHSAILFERSVRFAERTLLLAELASTPAEAAILYNTLAQGWAEARALPVVDTEPVLVARADASAALGRAQKCVQLANAAEAAGKAAEATALLERAVEVIAGGVALLDGAASDADVDAVKAQLSELDKAVRSRTIRARAAAVLGVAPAPKKQQRVEGASSAPIVDIEELEVAGIPAAKGAATQTATFDVDAPNVVALPPRFVAMPVKPVFFDLAERYVDYPSLGGRAAAAGAVARHAVEVEEEDAQSPREAAQKGSGITGYLSSWWGGKK